MAAKKKSTSATPAERRGLVRLPLASVGGLIAEAAKVYRLARGDQMEPDKARSLVWMLGQIRAMVETKALADIEARLDAIAEGRSADAYESTDRQAARPH